MNREIKFRAIIKSKLTGKSDCIKFTLNDFINPLFSIRELVIPWLLEGGTPNIYTGLNDKNEVEIYEGDIVNFIFGSWSTINPARIVFENCCWGLYWIGQKHEDDTGFKSLWNTCDNEIGWNLNESTVVGNIYQNPELLEATPC